jgi:hypothetical protein
MDMPYTLAPVSGKKFYGREELLNRLKNPDYRRRSLIIGPRRIGKTSLLRELERQITDETPHIALYINLLGIPAHNDLVRLLIGQCREKGAYLEAHGFNVANLARGDDFFELLGALNDAMRFYPDDYLFLLVDEAGIMANYESSFLERLRGSFDGHAKIRWILTDSQPIYRFDETSSNLLNEFAPSIYLPRLDKESSMALIRQSKVATPMEVEDGIAVAICEKTGRHPYLLQLLCSHLYAEGRLNEVTDELFNKAYTECDEARILPAAYGLLKPIEKHLFLHLPEIHETGLRRLAFRWGQYEDTLKRALNELVQLGYVKQGSDNTYLPADDFWNRWIDSNRPSLRRELETSVVPSPQVKPAEPSTSKAESRDGGKKGREPSQEKLGLVKIVTLLFGFGGIIGLITLLMKLVPSWKPIEIILLVVTVGAIVLGAMGFLKSEQVTQLLKDVLRGKKGQTDKENSSE